MFFTSHSDGSAHIWKFNGESIEQETSYIYNWMPITSINQSYNNKLMLSTSKDHYSYIWKTNVHDTVLYQLYGHKDKVTYGEFISDDLCVTSSYDTTIKLWKIKQYD